MQESDGNEGGDSITIRHIDNEELAFDPATLAFLEGSTSAPKFELAVTGKAYGIIFYYYCYTSISF